MYDQASNAKLAGAEAPESNWQQAARGANNAIESLADSIANLRNRLEPVLRAENATSEGKPVPTPVESAASSATYTLRGMTGRADHLRAMVDDLLRRLDI